MANLTRPFKSMLVYIDTNIFIDFYQSATDRLDAFNEIIARASQVVLPEQTVNEFHRNRVGCLATLLEKIEKNAKPSLHTVAAVRDLPEFQQWKALSEQAHQSAMKIAEIVKRWMNEPTEDQVLQAFDQLASLAQRHPITGDLIKRARCRKLLGDPPTSPDKHTVGDELIWETLLANVRDDLLVVSRDRTFLTNASLLQSEFQSSTGSRLVLITDKLSTAFRELNAPATAIEKAEKSVESARDRKEDQEFGQRTGICPRCKHPLSETGLDASDAGPDVWWLYCPNCQYEVFPE
ncbi:MAG: PIN domain-containing protein [Planctomycetaceae bacterium]